ncbi:MAG: hypothetical protein ACI9E1_001293 [Cryomorphaceae bacterium]|jgi:hypothetical protein
MLFSKNKKLQRDRNAGLVFRWRGGFAYNRGGSTIAFLVTSLMFAGGFIMLNVYAKPSTVPSRYRASMIQLGMMDDDLTWWLEKNSPNLPIWSENRDEQSALRVNAQLMEELREANSGAYLYEDVEMQQIEIDDEEIYALNNRWLPSLKRLKANEDGPIVAVADAVWKLKVNASKMLKPRLPDELEYVNWIPEKWRGRSVRLIIAVDARGKVLSVNPAEWTEDRTVKEFENWVHTLLFKPADKEQRQTVTGVISLSYSPIINIKEKQR